MPTTETILRTQFLDYLFGTKEGYLCLAIGIPREGQKDGFNQSFFKWPEQKDEAREFIEGAIKYNVWFCVNLLDEATRTKEHCLPTNLVWADLDTCKPELLDPPPTAIIQSSPSRYQAIWRLSEDVPAAVAEEFSKRIYSKYKEDGVDSGWALTKLLRVPFTKNFKYAAKPDVLLLEASDDLIDPSVFENILIEELSEKGEDVALPDFSILPAVESVLYKYRLELINTPFVSLYSNEPDEDWSKQLWHLIKICFEAGMEKEEVLVVVAASKCNKYERDKRPITHLWLDVLKAFNEAQTFALLSSDLEDKLEFPEIINDDERELIVPSWIDNYIEWACSVTDANTEYHEICGSMLLSMRLADKLHLKARHGKIVPNLWGLVLGESTLSRKTTAMNLAMDFVLEIDPESVVLSEDSSSEGLFRALSLRPELVSIFHRDEVAGFFEAMTSKSYMAGIPETLAKLYDVPMYLPRQLSKETIIVQKPVFIFFGGGIQERVYEAVDEKMFHSGFLPRFFVVNGESNIDNLQWIGPPSANGSMSHRDTIKSDLVDIVGAYKVQIISGTILGQEAEISKEIEVFLTNEAWEKQRSIEQILTLTANASSIHSIALPTFTRLSTSILKLAILLAAIRQEPRDFSIEVELRDILKAANFASKWAPHTIHMMMNVGMSAPEKKIQRILKWIRANPGRPRSDVVRHFRLQTMEAKIILGTLEERGQIYGKQQGRGTKIWPV